MLCDLIHYRSGLLCRCHARRVAACSAVVMRVDWLLIPPPCAWRLACDCVNGLCFSMVSVLACSFSCKLRCAIKIPGYLIARVMASTFIVVQPPRHGRCRSKVKQQFPCGKGASVDIVDSADFYRNMTFGRNERMR